MDRSIAYVPTMAALALAAMVCCSGSVIVVSDASSGSGEPSVDASKEISSLSLPELQALCDWGAQQQGGYGAMVFCEASGVPLGSPGDQAQCVAGVMAEYDRATCTTTVGEWTMCVGWFVANRCSVAFPPPPAWCDAFLPECHGPLVDAGGD